MSLRIRFACAAAALLLPTVASSTETRTLVSVVPGSEVIYSPTPWIWGVADCNRCNLDVASGSLTIIEDLLTGEAKIEGVALRLTSGQIAPDSEYLDVDDIATRAAGWLEFLTLTPDPDSPGPGNYVALRRNRPVFSVSTTDGGVTFIGGYDSTPVDGDALFVDLNGVIVPEPSAVPIVASLLAAIPPRTPRRSRAPSGRSAP